MFSKKTRRDNVFMTKKKDKPALEEIVIDELTFIEKIKETLETLDDQEIVIDNLKNQYIKLYNSYLFDKPNYNLRFYIKDGCICYDKLKKSVIGFKKT